MEELSELYAAFAAGRQAQLPEPTLQFSDFARWQRRWSHQRSSNPAARLLEASLAGRLTRISHRRRPSKAPCCARALRTNQLHVQITLVARLQRVKPSAEAATLFMTLLAGFKTLLMARSGRNDICVATAMANRSQLNTERVIGPLVNTTLIRTQIDADLSFQEALGRVRDSVLEAYARQELPFEILAARLAEEDGLDPVSLIQVSFILQNAVRAAQAARAWRSDRSPTRTGSGSSRSIALGFR